MKLAEFNPNDDDFILENQDENLQNFDIDELFEIPESEHNFSFHEQTEESYRNRSIIDQGWVDKNIRYNI